jgi:hypothetical protein
MRRQRLKSYATNHERSGDTMKLNRQLLFAFTLAVALVGSLGIAVGMPKLNTQPTHATGQSGAADAGWLMPANREP